MRSPIAARSSVLAGIFVGGASSRMGVPAKGLLPAPSGERSLVERWQTLLVRMELRCVLVIHRVGALLLGGRCAQPLGDSIDTSMIGFTHEQKMQNTLDRAAAAVIVHDQLDQDVSIDTGLIVARGWPGARFKRTHGLGHNRILRNPEDGHDLVADLQALAGGVDLGHDAGGLGARRKGEGRPTLILAGDDQGRGEAHACGLDLDPDLAGLERLRLDLFQTQIFGAAPLAANHRPHNSPLRELNRQRLHAAQDQRPTPIGAVVEPRDVREAAGEAVEDDPAFARILLDLARESGFRAVVAMRGDAGLTLARELRRKMSLMAERLFKSGDLPAAPVAIGPAHDHHTEIDLGGLDEDDHDLTAATFVGVDERATDPHAGRSEPTASKGEGGELARGTADAPALIARMFVTDFTGRVVFHAERAEKVIHFEGGRPVFASSNLARDRMGELLVREGKITREQHDRCQDQVRDTGRRMGEILVDRGYLKRRELLPAVRRHVEDIIYSLFAWDRGDYRLIVGDGATGERIRLSRHPAAMVLEGVRRKLDRATLERLVGPPTTHVEIADRDKLSAIVGAADLSNEERAALAGLDGANDLATVSRAAGVGLAGLYPLVWSLMLLGLASARRRAGDDDGDAPALIGESDLAIDRARVRARAALVADADYFALLGVRPDATGFEIKRAYEAARRDFAADGFPAELRKELERELDEIAVVLDEAYRVLRDDALRAAYRAHLREPDEAA